MSKPLNEEESMPPFIDRRIEPGRPPEQAPPAATAEAARR